MTPTLPISRRYRNRRIGEFLKELDLTEGRSTGISKILRVMTENGSPLPEFETDNQRSYFLIRLPAHPGALLEEDEGSVESSVNGSVKSSVKILSLMRENPHITIRELADVLDLTTRGIEKQIAKLKETGRIERIGPAKGGHWVVKEDA